MSLSFRVTRKTSELIPPAKPTPHKFKLLSDIDDQDGLRFHILGIQFYRKNPSMEGKDPTKVICNAIAKALIFYYPFAGRLREFSGRKLVVECTGEGSVFDIRPYLGSIPIIDKVLTPLILIVHSLGVDLSPRVQESIKARMNIIND